MLNSVSLTTEVTEESESEIPNSPCSLCSVVQLDFRNLHSEIRIVTAAPDATQCPAPPSPDTWR
jgi:hypothetical protein